MRNVFGLLGSAVAISGLCVGAASAQVLFHDDFEDEAVGTVLGPPTVGTWVEGAGSGVNGVAIVSSPAFGLRSMRLMRESAPPLGPSNADITAVSLPGAVLDGNQVEVKWSLNHEGSHRFNNPMQVSIGQVGSNFNNDFTFVYISDSGNGTYAYYSGPGQFGVNNTSGVQASLNTPGANEGKWDAFRLVLSLSQLNPTQMSGTMDLFVSIDGGAEIQLADDALLQTTTLPGVDPTKLQVRFVKGPASFVDFYDDVSITVVPEPATAALGVMGLGLLVRRRTRV